MAKRKQPVSVKEIAEAVGVSPSTVSMVLNDKAGEFRIAESTSERIVQTASELGYHPANRVKRKKRSFNKMLVCLFCPTNFDKGPSFYAGIHQYFEELNLKYETILFPYELGRLRDKMAFISKDFISGAIMMALTEEDIAFLEHTKFDIPIVLFNRTAKGYCSVLTDDYTVGHSAMEQFIKRGHTSFGIISPDYSSRALSLRSTGYWDKLRSSGLETQGAYVAPVAYGNDSDTGGYAAAQELLHSARLPMGLFVPSDNMIGGVIRCFREQGLKVPGDLDIISYGDKPVNEFVSPTITSFVPPTVTMSYNCAQLLHRFVEAGVWSDQVKLSFEAKCVYRESCPE